VARWLQILAPILLGLGLDEIVSIPSNPHKQAINQLTVAEAGDRKSNIETGFRSSVRAMVSTSITL